MFGLEAMFYCLLLAAKRICKPAGLAPDWVELRDHGKRVDATGGSVVCIIVTKAN